MLTNRSISLSNTYFGIESKTSLLVMSFSPIGPIVSSVSLSNQIALIPSRHPGIETERDIIRLVR